MEDAGMADMAAMVGALVDMEDVLTVGVTAGDIDYGSMDVCDTLCRVICVRL